MIRWLFGGDKNNHITGQAPEISQDVRTTLRAVFDTPNGVKALAYLLSDLGFMDQATTPQGIPLTGEALIRFTAYQDYARRLLEMIGALHEANVEEMTRDILALPVQKTPTIEEM